MKPIELAAIVGIICFYLLYFGKQLLLRRRGITANRMAKGEKPKNTRRVERWLLGVTYGMGAVQALCAVLALLPSRVAWVSLFFGRRLPLLLCFAGAVLVWAGAVLFGMAVVQMGHSWRAGVDNTQQTDLVTEGVYRVSRNPAFAGFDLLYLGTALVFPNLLTVCGFVLAALLLHLQIGQEERYLTGVFGQDYEAYRKGTGRYFLWL